MRRADRPDTRKRSARRLELDKAEPVSLGRPHTIALWVQHILDGRGSYRLFDSRSLKFSTARVSSEARTAWKACGQSLSALSAGPRIRGMVRLQIVDDAGNPSVGRYF